jgi:predicted nucleic acid-binding protein
MPSRWADAWIAAAAQQEGEVLVHKDPEFQAISSLAQEWLG